VPIPPTVARVLPAGPPASILLYTVTPNLLIGWSRALRPEARAFVLPDIAARPEVGRLKARIARVNPAGRPKAPDLTHNLSRVAEVEVCGRFVE
jgi:hypothetical protein